MNKEICYSDLVLLTSAPEDNLKLLYEHGAEIIEWLMDGIAWDDMKGQIKQIKKVIQHYPLKYSVHPPAWDTNLTSENRTIRQATFKEYELAIQFAHEIEAEHVVIHPGFCFSPIFDKKIAQERAKEAINKLCHVAKPLGVKLVIENVGYQGTSTVTEEEFPLFLSDIDETAGYLLDTGHAHLNGWDIPNMLKRLESRLFAIHIHDNNGQGDEHLAIGEGAIDWEPIFDTLKGLNSACQLILEYAPGTELYKLKRDKELIRSKLSQ